MHSPGRLSGKITQVYRSRSLRRLRADPASRVGLGIIVLLIVTTTVVIIDKQFLRRALITRLWGDPYMADLRSSLESPSLAHPFGTDHLGRDTLARVIYGTQTSVLVGLASVAISLPLGTVFGMLSAYLGGTFDEIVMRIMDVFLTPPANILALGLVGILGRGLENIILGIGIVYTPIFARLMRGSALKIKRMEFVEAATAIGESQLNIIFRELLPNCLTPLVIQATFSIALAIMWEAGMSFLGLGVMPPASSWGLMLHEGQQYLREAWWLSIFPGVAIMLTTLGFNLVGNGLRDALDPKYQAVQP